MSFPPLIPLALKRKRKENICYIQLKVLIESNQMQKTHYNRMKNKNLYSCKIINFNPLSLLYEKVNAAKSLELLLLHFS